MNNQEGPVQFDNMDAHIIILIGSPDEPNNPDRNEGQSANRQDPHAFSAPANLEPRNSQNRNIMSPVEQPHFNDDFSQNFRRQSQNNNLQEPAIVFEFNINVQNDADDELSESPMILMSQPNNNHYVNPQPVPAQPQNPQNFQQNQGNSNFTFGNNQSYDLPQNNMQLPQNHIHSSNFHNEQVPQFNDFNANY